MAATDTGLTPQPGREAPQLAAGLAVAGCCRSCPLLGQSAQDKQLWALQGLGSVG